MLTTSGPTAAFADESLDTRENTDLTLKCRFTEKYDADNFTFYWTRWTANPAQYDNVAIGEVQLNSGYRWVKSLLSFLTLNNNNLLDEFWFLFKFEKKCWNCWNKFREIKVFLFKMWTIHLLCIIGYNWLSFNMKFATFSFQILLLPEFYCISAIDFNITIQFSIFPDKCWNNKNLLSSRTRKCFRIPKTDIVSVIYSKFYLFMTRN